MDSQRLGRCLGRSVKGTETKMSKLYLSGTTDAIKTERTARGHKQAECHVRGWKHGVRVTVSLSNNGIATYQVWATAGSNGNGFNTLLATLTFNCARS